MSRSVFDVTPIDDDAPKGGKNPDAKVSLATEQWLGNRVIRLSIDSVVGDPERHEYAILDRRDAARFAIRMLVEATAGDCDTEFARQVLAVNDSVEQWIRWLS